MASKAQNAWERLANVTASFSPPSMPGASCPSVSKACYHITYSLMLTLSNSLESINARWSHKTRNKAFSLKMVRSSRVLGIRRFMMPQSLMRHCISSFQWCYLGFFAFEDFYKRVKFASPSLFLVSPFLIFQLLIICVHLSNHSSSFRFT